MNITIEYTARHNTVITVKGSTLDRASDRRSGKGASAVAPFYWSGKAHGQQ
jgi:hypothetical protein